EGERQSSCVIGTGTFEVPGFGLEHVVDAVAVFVDPLADGVASVGRNGPRRPVAPIREDAAKMVRADDDIGCFWSDDVFMRAKRHPPRHAAGAAGGGGVISQAAVGLILHAVPQDLLILRRQRRLLAGSPGLGLIEGALNFDLAVDLVSPLPFPVGWILQAILRQDIAIRCAKRCRERNRRDRVSEIHGPPPCYRDAAAFAEW